MSTFTDASGRTWNIEINVDAIKLVKEALGIDIGRLANEGKLYPMLLEDVILLNDVSFVLCRSQANERGVTDTMFGKGMAGDALDDATKALMEAMTDFFPNPRLRSLQKKAMGKIDGMQDKLMQAAEAEIESGSIERMMDRQLERLRSVTSSQESSGSTPAP